MKYASHFVCTAALAASLNHTPPFVLAAVVSASFPDVIEKFIPGVHHRGLTHILGFWVSVYLISLIFNFDFLSGWAFGCLAHVALDAFSYTGVPILPGVKDRLSIKAYATSSHHEIIFVPIVFLASFFLWMICNAQMKQLFLLKFQGDASLYLKALVGG